MNDESQPPALTPEDLAALARNFQGPLPEGYMDKLMAQLRAREQEAQKAREQDLPELDR